MKKQTIIALVLLLLIPVVSILGGFFFGLINPEIAAGHPNYARNYHYLYLVKMMAMWSAAGVAGILWLLACFLVIRSKGRSLPWLFFAALGPFGFAILTMLNDRAPAETDRHARFVRGLNRFLRIGYEACIFLLIWFAAFEAMLIGRKLIILYQSAVTGMSVAQIVDIQNASSGMWAFAEMNEVMYLVALFYLLWPAVFNIVAGLAAGPLRVRA